MRKRRLFSALIFVIPAVLAAATIAVADGGKTSFKANLNGYEETPSVSSTGIGSFDARVAGDEISFTLTYEALEGTTTTAAHIHLGQPGVAGGVIAFMCGGGGKPACPATSGTVTGTITAADVIGPTGQGIAPGEFDEVIRAFRAGYVYPNVHTNKHPGGEIRGQANDANQNSN
jgi:CHRD domain